MSKEKLDVEQNVVVVKLMENVKVLKYLSKLKRRKLYVSVDKSFLSNLVIDLKQNHFFKVKLKNMKKRIRIN